MRLASEACYSLIGAVSLLAMMSIVQSATAQTSKGGKDEPIGQSTFLRNCASCHGKDGKGDGPLSELMTTKVADLTTIMERNKGVFPQEYLYKMIDGREMKSWHGTREMPVWGDVFMEQSVQDFWPWGSEQLVRGRILEVIYYIQSLQRK